MTSTLAARCLCTGGEKAEPSHWTSQKGSVRWPRMQTAEASRARAECGRASRELRGRFTLRHSDENITRIRGQRPERKHARTPPSATHAAIRQTPPYLAPSSSHHHRCVFPFHPAPTLKTTKPVPLSILSPAKLTSVSLAIPLFHSS